MSAAIVEGLRRNATIGLAFGLAGVLFLIGTAHSSGFASTNHIRNVLVAASFVGLVGFGQTLCILTGGIDLSIPATVAGGAVLTGYPGRPAGLAAALDGAAARRIRPRRRPRQRTGSRVRRRAADHHDPGHGRRPAGPAAHLHERRHAPLRRPSSITSSPERHSACPTRSSDLGAASLCRNDRSHLHHVRPKALRDRHESRLPPTWPVSTPARARRAVRDLRRRQAR